MSAQYLLEVHRAEREALLRRLTDQLHHDEHVAAAWLAGAGVQDAVHRGEADTSDPGKIFRRRSHGTSLHVALR